jgi:hypothetical protein
MSNLPLHTRRLAGLVNRPGGITVSEAVAAAETNLATIRDRGLEEITAIMLRIQGLGERLRVQPDAALQMDLYTASNSLVGIAGVFGLGGLGEVAFSLCNLLDRLRAANLWSFPSVQIHLDSMRLAQTGTLTEAEMTSIATALRQVVDRIPNAHP